MKQVSNERAVKLASSGPISSAVLTRLINEVRNEGPHAARAYDRTHNRHNR
jgi:hypothetical protein